MIAKTIICLLAATLATQPANSRFLFSAADEPYLMRLRTEFELDDVIDPADSRRWIMTALRSVPPPPKRRRKKRPQVDTW